MPNAELLDMCLAMPDVLPTEAGWQDHQPYRRNVDGPADSLSLADGFSAPPVEPSLGLGHVAYDTTDPGDLLAAYMLESAQASAAF